MGCVGHCAARVAALSPSCWLRAAFDPHRGAKWHAARKIPYGRTCSPGDVVGCLLDADTKRVEFSLNGSFDPPFGAAFLDMMPMDDAFLPAVSLSAHGAEVQLRIDAAALRFRPPHGARPIGEAPARGLSVARQAIDLQVGTHVRLRAAVTEPRYGMGRLRRGEVGVVQKVTGEVVRINFPLAGMWNGLSSELEPATCFVVGDMVQVKAGVGEPRYGWGEVRVLLAPHALPLLLAWPRAPPLLLRAVAHGGATAHRSSAATCCRSPPRPTWATA